MTLPAIRTERLWMRGFNEHEVDAVHRLWADPAVRLYLWDDIVISRERAAEVAGRGSYWTLHLAEDSEVMGFCGFRHINDGSDVELMYGILPAYWGRGLATEASRAALGYLWNSTDHHRVYARADASNAKSIEVMRRLGMRQNPSTAAMVIYVLERPGQ